MGRLNPAQAAEVDALVMTTREHAAENMNPALRGNMSEGMMAQLQTPAATAASNETMEAILAALVRVEKLIMMIVTICFNRALAGKLSGNAPLLTEGDAVPQANPAQLPAWQGRVVEMPQTDVMLSSSSRGPAQLPAWNGGGMVVYGNNTAS